MIMKKYLTTFLVACLAVVMAVALTACGEVSVESVALNKTELSLLIGEEETLSATITPDDATNKTVSWESSDNTVATVVDGKVTALAEGSTTITVTTKDGEKSAKCSVTVTAPIMQVAGKKFKFSSGTIKYSDDYKGEKYSSEYVASMNAYNEKLSFTFATDGTVTENVENAAITISINGTYVQNGEKVTVTLTYEGQTISADMVVEGQKLVSYTEISSGVTQVVELVEAAS
jgi:transglutaminase/protease-like cytokinesis protein 3